MLLSIAMIVKNEEKNLPRTLEALMNLKNKINFEIIIVDTGSSDNTISVAKKYTNKIYEKQWTGNFSKMRNYSISKCKGDWILILDADEVLENPEELVVFFKSNDMKKNNSATIKFKNIISNKEDDYTIGTLVRLFKNKKEFYYVGRVHEQPKILAPTKLTNITLIHYGYSRESYKLMRYKYERNLQLLLEDLKEDNNNPYTYFQLAQTYGMANLNDKAYESISKAYELIKDNGNKVRYMYIYHLLAMHLVANGNYKKAIEISTEAIKYRENHLDFYYFMAKAHHFLNDFNEAEYYYNEYFKLLNKLENGYLVEDISVNNMSFARKKEMIKDRFVVAFKNKDYKYIIENHKAYQEEDIEEILIYTFIKEECYENIFNYYIGKNIEDKNINTIILACEKVVKENFISDIIGIYEKLLGLDKKLDFYINYIYKEEKFDLNYIDFNNYYIYKSKIFTKYILDDKGDINIIKILNKNHTYYYLNVIINDYKGIDLLYQYSKNNFMNNEISNLRFINIVEDFLIKNENIKNDDYYKLFYRAFINKINYINNVYNKEVLKYFYKEVCNKDEVFFISLFNLFNTYSIDRYGYIKELRKMVKEYPEYKVLINYLKDNIKIDDIDNKAILSEKENLINNIQILIENNRIEDAEDVLNEIYELFKYDSKINNLRGIIRYFWNDYEEALIHFGLSKLFKDDDFDSTYNLALVLEELERNKDSIIYYTKALELCNDDGLKEAIINKTNNIK